MFGDRTCLEKPYFVQELVADLAYNNVTHTVHVECGQFYERAEGVPKHLQCVGETRRLQEVADGAAVCCLPRVCGGIVAHADLDLGGAMVAEQLDGHLAAGRNVRGVRDQVAYAPLHAAAATAPAPAPARAPAPDPGIHSATKDPFRLRDPAFREGLALLQARHLAYDCFLYHPQLPQLAELAEAFPGVTIVCNHAGMPLGICSYASESGTEGSEDHTTPGLSWEGDIATEWRAGVTEVARYPNVFMKLGGLTFPACGFGFDKRAKPPTSEELAGELAPWYNFVIDAFGAERCMFESNFPMDKGSCSYTVLWNAFKRIAAQRNCTEAEMTALFSGTAKRVYNLKD